MSNEQHYPIGRFAEYTEQNPYYANFCRLPYAWLYIAIDIRDLTTCKIGLTSKAHPRMRLAEGKTYNPFLELYTIYELSATTWGCSREELQDIESYIHNRHIFGAALRFPESGRDTEWFRTTPDEAEWQIDYILAKRGFSVDQFTLYDTAERVYLTPDQKFRINDIHFEAMKKIKTIFRPDPYTYSERACAAGMNYHEYKSYIEHLEKFHAGDWIHKIYLK